jgi:hypothetical protein
VGITSGRTGRAGAVSTVGTGEGVGFAVSGFGAGVALGATVAAGVIFGVMTGVGETTAVWVGTTTSS